MKPEDVKIFELNKGDEECKHENVVSKMQSIKFSFPVITEMVGICEDCGMAFKYILNNSIVSDSFSHEDERFKIAQEKYNIKL